jgi:hypothetical protein
MADIPAASAIETSQEEFQVDMDSFISSMKGMDLPDLLKLLKAAATEAEKKTKGTKGKAIVAGKAKKAGSAPKGVAPPQLAKPRAWVEFTLKHALDNGWEEFTVCQKKKDKASGEVIEEEILMPAAEMHDGGYWVYEGSVTDKNPTGRQIIHKEAMSLSKQRWAPKTKTGTHPELYEEFEAQYVPEDVPEEASEASESSSKTVVRMTAAEKLAEQEQKKAEKEAAKEQKKAEKEAAKEQKKADKEREKAAAKAAKEAEKSTKAPAKKTATAPIPAGSAASALAAKKAAAAPVKPTAATASAAKPVAKPVAKKVVKKEEWTCPADGNVYPWSWKGKSYLRDSDNQVWEQGADGGLGAWAGVYDATVDKIDDSAAEPSFDDEE